MAEQAVEIAIIGGGPAGLAAALYAARGRRRTVLVERGVIGGQISLTERVENYPGFVEGINGFDLARAMQEQAEKYSAKSLYAEISRVEPVEQEYRLLLGGGEESLKARAVIVTVGADYNKLGVTGEERLTGRGVSYCATCDAAFFREQEVALVGGGDAAMDEALFTTRYASKVHVIHRRDQLRASAVLQERAFANPKIDFTWDTAVEEIVGESQVTSLRLRHVETGQGSTLDVAAIFIFIGQHPNTGFLKGLVEMDNGGHILVNEWMETSSPGVFAAGDARANSARQVATAAGDGVTAAIRADHYISETFRE